jgi:hypothetical protein
MTEKFNPGQPISTPLIRNRRRSLTRNCRVNSTRASKVLFQLRIRHSAGEVKARQENLDKTCQ